MDYIEGTLWLGSRPGLDRVRELLRRLGDPQRGLKFVHVAGTNGKGSICALISCIFCAAGYRTGLYTSPYLWRFNERMRVCGEAVSDEALARIVTRVAEAAGSMDDDCTEFELITAAAFLWFAEEQCDIVVLEVGLGGRLDATNVIAAPECAVIANIGLDHTAILGDTVEKIAAEKAGIIKGGAVVSYDQTESVAAVLREKCAQNGANLTFADFSAIEGLTDSREGQTFTYRGSPYAIPLLGRHQLCNAATALTCVDALRRAGWDIPEEAVRRGLAAARWPARFEIVGERPYFVVDGGHNPQCVATTAEALERYFPKMRRVLLVGVLADKDWRAMMATLAPLADGFVTVTPLSERALSAEALAEALEVYRKPVICAGSIPEGVERARALAGTDGMVCSVGSLYMAGAVRHCFGLDT